jgi:hypothetical protein
MKKLFIFLLVVFLFLALGSSVSGKSNEDTRPAMTVEVSSACVNKDVTVKVSNQKGTLLEGEEQESRIRKD